MKTNKELAWDLIRLWYLRNNDMAYLFMAELDQLNKEV